MDINSATFRNNVIQDYLDLIEFANGDPESSSWAAVRRDMGHPEPFGLDMWATKTSGLTTWPSLT